MPTCQLTNYKIHYRQQGKGKALVLLHGLGNNSQSWKSQLEELKDDFHIIAWDAPGYGGSSDPTTEIRTFSQFADVLKEFMDALEIKSVILLGHSMGSAIAIDFAHRFPEIVDLLIISDATRGAAGVSLEENEKKLKNRIHNIETLTPHELAQKRVPSMLSPNASATIVKEAERIMAQVRPSGYKSVSYSLSHLDQMDILPQINVPTLVVCGELDTVTPVSEARIFHEKIPKSELAIIPNTGHLCYLEDPYTFNMTIKKFIKQQII